MRDRYCQGRLVVRTRVVRTRHAVKVAHARLGLSPASWPSARALPRARPRACISRPPTTSTPPQMSNIGHVLPNGHAESSLSQTCRGPRPLFHTEENRGPQEGHGEPRPDRHRNHIPRPRYSGHQPPKTLRAKRHNLFLRGPLWSSFFLRVKNLPAHRGSHARVCPKCEPTTTRPHQPTNPIPPAIRCARDNPHPSHEPERFAHFAPKPTPHAHP
jgi:hypothetical protein